MTWKVLTLEEVAVQVPKPELGTPEAGESHGRFQAGLTKMEVEGWELRHVVQTGKHLIHYFHRDDEKPVGRTRVIV